MLSMETVRIGFDSSIEAEVKRNGPKAVANNRLNRAKQTDDRNLAKELRKEAMQIMVRFGGA